MTAIRGGKAERYEVMLDELSMEQDRLEGCRKGIEVVDGRERGGGMRVCGGEGSCVSTGNAVLSEFAVLGNGCTLTFALEVQGRASARVTLAALSISRPLSLNGKGYGSKDYDGAWSRLWETSSPTSLPNLRHLEPLCVQLSVQLLLRATL